MFKTMIEIITFSINLPLNCIQRIQTKVCVAGLQDPHQTSHRLLGGAHQPHPQSAAVQNPVRQGSSQVKQVCASISLFEAEAIAECELFLISSDFDVNGRGHAFSYCVGSG